MTIDVQPTALSAAISTVLVIDEAFYGNYIDIAQQLLAVPDFKQMAFCTVNQLTPVSQLACITNAVGQLLHTPDQLIRSLICLGKLA